MPDRDTARDKEQNLMPWSTSEPPLRTQLKNGGLRIRARCACGAWLDVSSNPSSVAERIYQTWHSWHAEPGCRLLTKNEPRPGHEHLGRKPRRDD